MIVNVSIFFYKKKNYNFQDVELNHIFLSILNTFFFLCFQNFVTVGLSEQQQNHLLCMQQQVQRNKNGWHTLLNVLKIYWEKVFFSNFISMPLITKKLKTNFLILGGKKPVNSYAAVWVPDNEADRCMHCKRTQFSMLQRRVN